MVYMLFDNPADKQNMAFLNSYETAKIRQVYPPQKCNSTKEMLAACKDMIKQSAEGDTIICWYDFMAVLCWWLCKVQFKNRKIIALNILLKDKATTKNKAAKLLYKPVLKSKKVQATVTSKKYGEHLNEMLGETNDKRVLIVGAGLIGLKCAEGIYQRVSELTVIDLAPRILPNVLTEVPAAIIQKHIESKGVKFLLGDSVAQFEPNKAHLKSGGEIDFDILVVAVGVRPNTELAAEAGCEVNRGILIDEHSATCVPNIYAAGDCTVSHDIAAGVDRILAILPNAYMQGETAGKNMADHICSFTKAIPMNASGFMGLHMITAGSYDGEAYLEQDDEHYKLLVTRDNRLVGFILIGDVDRAGIYTSLIREQTPLDTIDFELIREKPQLMAFSHAERAKKLGGAH